MKKLLGLASSILALFGVGCASNQIAKDAPRLNLTEYQLVFEDQFEGAIGSPLDPAIWEPHANGPRRDAVNTNDAITLDGNGSMVITTYTEDETHYTGIAQTVRDWKYGYFEARIDFQGSGGMWSAFWMMPREYGKVIGDPGVSGVEIDIMEHLADVSIWYNSAKEIHNAVHWDGYQEHLKSRGNTTTGIDVSQGFHLYGVEWTPDFLKFYVDHKLVWTFTEAIPHVPEYMLLSSEVQDKFWAGKVPKGGYGSKKESETKMIVDYVRVYQVLEE